MNPEAKRLAILAAATELFASRGYEATSIAAIAGKAGVAVGTVHRIFHDKANVLMAAQTEIETQLTKAMVKGWQGQGLLDARFRSMLEALFDEMVIALPMMPIMALKPESQGLPKDGQIVRQAIRGFMRDEIAAGAFRPMPINEATEIVFGMVDSAMRHAATGDLTASKHIYVPLLAGMMARAVAPE